MIQCAPHPLLDAVAFETRFPVPLGQLAVSDEVRSLFSLSIEAPMRTDAAVKTAIRDLLRHGGFSPSGRSKPASEYLIKATEKGWLAPDRGINAAVDALNAVSLHSGLPISVIDLELATAPFHVEICPADTSYVFNPAGQELRLDKLLALHDAHGPCANAVKDSQRTKTHDRTLRTLSIVWGSQTLAGRSAEAAAWNRRLLEGMGAQTETIEVGAVSCGR